jgi:hypothetical protein
MKLVFLVLVLFSVQAYSYVISKTESGSDIRWTKSSTNLDLHINAQPFGTAVGNISKIESESIIQNSIEQWNTVSTYKINPIYTSSTPLLGTSKTLSYSNDSRYFGSGVVAVTRISYNATSGDISAADILINGNGSGSNSIYTTSKSSSSNNQFYLGDVVTHELGHFFGLSHSEHINSSMVFSIFKGQHTIHSDDIAGIYDLYDIETNTGEISGRVITGNSIPVFGVKVTAISTISGDPVQSQLTNGSGEYLFKNLSLNDSYYIMVSPYLNLSNISSTTSDGSQYYSTPKYNFCSQNDFKVSFYTQCGPRSKSIPQTFYLDATTTTLNVGDVTIRCDENINSIYYSKKFESVDRSFELNDNTNQSSFLFTGIFSDSEIAVGDSGPGDEFSIDLTGIDTEDFTASAYKLRIKLLSSGINSGMGLKVVTQRGDDVSSQTHLATTDDTGKTITDFEINLALSATTANNTFSIKVYPVTLSSTQKYEIFSSESSLTNNSSQYVLNAQVGMSINSIFVPLNTLDSYPYEDNSSCTEGEANYTVAAHTSLTSAINNAEQLPVDEDIAGVSCGTIDIDDDSNSSGMGSFIVGFLLILLSTAVPRSNNSISRFRL